MLSDTQSQSHSSTSFSQSQLCPLLQCVILISNGRSNQRIPCNPTYSPNPPTTLTFLPLFLLLNKQSPATETCSPHHSFYKITIPTNPPSTIQSLPNQRRIHNQQATSTVDHLCSFVILAHVSFLIFRNLFPSLLPSGI